MTTRTHMVVIGDYHIFLHSGLSCNHYQSDFEYPVHLPALLVRKKNLSVRRWPSAISGSQFIILLEVIRSFFHHLVVANRLSFAQHFGVSADL